MGNGIGPQLSLFCLCCVAPLVRRERESETATAGEREQETRIVAEKKRRKPFQSPFGGGIASPKSLSRWTPPPGRSRALWCGQKAPSVRASTWHAVPRTFPGRGQQCRAGARFARLAEAGTSRQMAQNPILIIKVPTLHATALRKDKRIW